VPSGYLDTDSRKKVLRPRFLSDQFPNTVRAHRMYLDANDAADIRLSSAQEIVPSFLVGRRGSHRLVKIDRVYDPRCALYDLWSMRTSQRLLALEN
jgi:hypothetical protein